MHLVEVIFPDTRMLQNSWVSVKVQSEVSLLIHVRVGFIIQPVNPLSVNNISWTILFYSIQEYYQSLMSFLFKMKTSSVDKSSVSIAGAVTTKGSGVQFEEFGSS